MDRKLRPVARDIAPFLDAGEYLVDLGVSDRLAADVRQEILLGDISNITRLLILGEEVIVRLILDRPDILRDRQPPLLGIGEFGIDIENDAAERVNPVTNDLPDLILGLTYRKHLSPSSSA